MMKLKEKSKINLKNKVVNIIYTVYEQSNVFMKHKFSCAIITWVINKIDLDYKKFIGGKYG